MFNAFINFGDIKGECTDKDHKDWVMITGFDHEVTQPPSVTQKNSRRPDRGGGSALRIQDHQTRRRGHAEALRSRVQGHSHSGSEH